MTTTLVIGLQWGDEGKGKIVDALTRILQLCVDFKVDIMQDTQLR
ncbi:MAG: hypothetical protein CM15mP127_01860 [Gammaproteobacteria bacterium]|nr:MAG: hypothetical protein CM15mP127_01860 [Gammaproteobacteria bacterium]